MKDILNFRNMQDMVNEANDFLSPVTDNDIKVCAKFLLITCYAYLNEFIGENSKKTYANLATLVKYEMLEDEYDTSNSNPHSKLYLLIQNVHEKSTVKKVYKLYCNCDLDLQRKARMHLMNLLLTYYIK